MEEEERQDAPQEEPEEGQEPQEEEQAPPQPPEEEEQQQQPSAEEAPKPRRGKKEKKKQDEVIPGEHLEPDLVLEEEERPDQAMPAEFAGAEITTEPEVEAAPVPEAPEEQPEPAEPEPVAHEPIDLAADARYQATGKRKTAVARVILRPGSGSYTINGRGLDEFFPRVRLQKIARQPLDTAGYGSRMDVVAKIHGGGVSSQAGALRHGIARALVEADPSLRIELKRRGYLTRDPREKERKKAGLKKARKRPQFSKR